MAAIDWGLDIDSAAFRWPANPVAANTGRAAGATRLVSLWDQRDHALGPRPEPYGYGSVHSRADIDRALHDPRPYERLGYHPAIADPQGRGAHGTRTMDIAAGNGEANGPAGIAPDADLIFVHLADGSTRGLANFGDSVRLLEALDYVSQTAGPQPCVINISAGRLCGPRDGSTLVERAFDQLLASTPGRFIVDSAGNYFGWRAHSSGTIAAGETVSLTVVVDPADVTLNEIEIWYDGADEFAVRVDPPGYSNGRLVRLGERADILIAGRVAGRVYNRRRDPGNFDNHIVAYLDPIGCPGNWTITLEARQVSSGRFHAWIERDDACRHCQARFAADDSNPSSTIGSIATSHLPLVVGAYDGHDPDRPVASFSSAGPCRDGRSKPDLAAPGVNVLAARSAPLGASRNAGLVVRGNGTSFAAPHVTGAAALCFEAADGRLSAVQLRSLILGNCDPVLGSDPDSRLGHGYLNIPRLLASVRQALSPPATAPGAKEPNMATEDTTVLAAAPAVAYREYLYHPDGQFARWISDRFDLVGMPGEPVDQPPRPGDVLLEVVLGRTGRGRCVTLRTDDPQVVATPPRLAPGQLLLRPLKRLEMSDPLPVEPTARIPDLTFLPASMPASMPAEQESPGTESGAAEGGPDPQARVQVAAGQLIVEHVPLLRAHAGTPPDMILTWNAMESPCAVDVVVHLHGFARRGHSMCLPTDKMPMSGLDLSDPRNRSSAGRTSPTLLVLPRGSSDSRAGGTGYDFPALSPTRALNELIEDAFARFSAQTRSHPARGRLILTAHSGGGAALMRILRWADPDEVHTFDALYNDPSPLIAWARQRIRRGSGALRVLYRPANLYRRAGDSTERASLAVEEAIRSALTAAGGYPSTRWRVESTSTEHNDIPSRFGWRLLADVSADLPGVGHGPAAGRHGNEMPDSAGEEEAAEAGQSWDHEALEDLEAFGEDDTFGEGREGGQPERRPLTTQQLRDAWAEYLCADRQMVTITLLSNRTQVNPAAVAAFAALADALRRTGYRARRAGGYNCRNVAQASSAQPPRVSLHAYGLAVDIDENVNPHRHNVSGPIIFSSEPSQEGRQQEVAAGVAGTSFTPAQVAAVEAIRTIDGLRVFGWGGRWRSSHDAMHFEIRLTPAELRRGIVALPASDGSAEAGPDHATCGCGGAVADESTSELAEFAPSGDADEEDFAAEDVASGDPEAPWDLYNQLPFAWGQPGGRP